MKSAKASAYMNPALKYEYAKKPGTVYIDKPNSSHVTTMLTLFISAMAIAIAAIVTSIRSCTGDESSSLIFWVITSVIIFISIFILIRSKIKAVRITAESIKQQEELLSQFAALEKWEREQQIGIWQNNEIKLADGKVVHGCVSNSFIQEAIRRHNLLP